MATIDIRIPDLGDFESVPVVEIHARVGDQILPEQGLISLESEKATMEVPSPLAGKVVEICVSVGERVSAGVLIARLETLAETAEPVAPPKPAPIPVPASGEGAADLVVIGGGPGGYSAAFRAADLGLSVTLVEREPVLGGVCLNVGCIPSKALLHLTDVALEARAASANGFSFAAPVIDLDAMRAYKSGVVRKLTGGLAGMARKRKVSVVRGEARFRSAHSLEIADLSGSVSELGFKRCIIAAGSSPVALPCLPDDPRIVDSTGALELPFIPKSMLIIGGGIIGLEMATVYSALGARVDVVEMADTLLQGVDSDLVDVWRKRNAKHFDRILLGVQVTGVKVTRNGIEARFSKDVASRTYNLILQAAGRRPNGAELNLEAAGLSHRNGFITVDAQMRTSAPHIFAIGDIVGSPMLAHKAVHEGHVAAEVVAGHKAAFDAHAIPSVAYTHPEIAWAGLTESEAARRGIDIKVAKFPWAASGRALASGAEYGLTKLIFPEGGGRILGGALVGPRAGDMIGEVVLAIEMGADAVDISKTIHPHPTFGETIGLAAEVGQGVCTDLPPA
ncbi:MAG: dihydrolipoyl dehydrogenase [Hyphomonadaceae bacterium]